MDGKILVPFPVESKLSRVARKVTPDDRVWYRRSFTVPADWRGENVMLNFGAVDYETTVRVNGSVVGSHKGGFDAFGFDITPYLKAGANEARKMAVSGKSVSVRVDLGGRRLRKKKKKQYNHVRH